MEGEKERGKMEGEKERGMEGEKERGKMEGEKEREREQGEEKESDEAEEEYEEDQEDEEEEEEDPEGAAQLWQEGQQDADVDELGLPIMHWEALSLRIAELEKQEEEKKKNAKQHSNSSLERGSCLERGRTPVSWMDDRDRGRSQRDVTATCWEDPEDDCNSRVSALTSRLGTHMNLQLCFINNSESEEDEEDEDDNKKKAVKRGTVQVPHPPQTAPAVAERTKPSRSFKNALRSLRDRLRTDHKQQVPPVVTRRRTLERQDLVAFSIKELNALCGSLSQAIQELSTDLVGRLQTRDQLRTEQDAMLVEVQDLTSL